MLLSLYFEYKYKLQAKLVRCDRQIQPTNDGPSGRLR